MIGCIGRQAGPPVGPTNRCAPGVNISSAIKPRPSATTCTALPDPRRAMLASPNRQATPTRPRSRPSACTKAPGRQRQRRHRAPSRRRRRTAPAAIPRLPDQQRQCRAATAGPYASKRGLTGPRSRRSTRSGGTSRSRSNGGRPKPSRVTKPVASAGRISCQDGAGSSPLPSSWPKHAAQTVLSEISDQQARHAGPAAPRPAAPAGKTRTISVSVAPTQRRMATLSQ